MPNVAARGRLRPAFLCLAGMNYKLNENAYYIMEISGNGSKKVKRKRRQYAGVSFFAMTLAIPILQTYTRCCVPS